MLACLFYPFISYAALVESIKRAFHYSEILEQSRWIEINQMQALQCTTCTIPFPFLTRPIWRRISSRLHHNVLIILLTLMMRHKYVRNGSKATMENKRKLFHPAMLFTPSFFLFLVFLQHVFHIASVYILPHSLFLNTVFNIYWGSWKDEAHARLLPASATAFTSWFMDRKCRDCNQKVYCFLSLTIFNQTMYPIWCDKSFSTSRRVSQLHDSKGPTEWWFVEKVKLGLSFNENKLWIKFA